MEREEIITVTVVDPIRDGVGKALRSMYAIDSDDAFAEMIARLDAISEDQS